VAAWRAGRDVEPLATLATSWDVEELLVVVPILSPHGDDDARPRLAAGARQLVDPVLAELQWWVMAEVMP